MKITYDANGNETPEFQAYKRVLQGQVAMLLESIAKFVCEHDGEETDYWVAKSTAFEMLVKSANPTLSLVDDNSLPPST